VEKKRRKKLDEEDLDTTLTTIKQKMTELQTKQQELDAALKVIEALKPTCIDTGMSYEKRKEMREAEMTALKKAHCLLDPAEDPSKC